MQKHKALIHSVLTIVVTLAVLKYAKAGTFGATGTAIANQIS